MTPRVGQPAPSFKARSDDGQTVDLTDLRGRWVILYFYPKAGTPGCSIEAQRFEQAIPEFERANAVVVGVSTDTEASQAKFRDRCQLSFPLLPDGDKTISRAYGVLGGLTGLLGVTGRQTFLIDPEGLLVHHWKTVDPNRHAPEVLRLLHEKQKG